MLEVYIDASKHGFQAVLFGDGCIIVMISVTNPKPHTHSTGSELERLVRALKAFRHYLLEKMFAILETIGRCYMPFEPYHGFRKISLLCRYQLIKSVNLFIWPILIGFRLNRHLIGSKF